MEEKKKKMIMTTLISFVVSVAILAIGITYAVFSASSTTDTQTVITGELSIKYEQGNILRTTNLYPIGESDVPTKATEFNFSVTNTGKILGYFEISLEGIAIDEELKNTNFKWRLLEDGVMINEGDFVGVETTKLLQRAIEIEKGKTKIYKILIWINETGSPQNEMQEKNLNAKVVVRSRDRLTEFALVEEAVLTNTIKGNEIQNLKLYGNTVDGVSVGTLDETTGNYTIGIVTSGKNLFNTNYMSVGSNYTLTITGGYKGVALHLKPNTTYTLNSKRTEKTELPSESFWYKVNNTGTSGGSHIGSYNINVDRYYFGKTTVTTGSDGLLYIVYAGNISNIYEYFNEFQLVEGEYTTDTMPEYEPYVEPITTNIYLNEPLRKVGDYADYIDFENKKVVRKIKLGQINGNSSFAKFGGVTDYSAFYMTNDELVGTDGPTYSIEILSNEFQYHNCGTANTNRSWSADYQIGSSISTTYKRICFTLPNTITDVASAKEWLADNPVDYYFPLNTPIEEEIELPSITTLYNTTILSTNTAVSGSFSGSY